MPKSKGRRHPQQKNRPVNVPPASVQNTANAEPAVKIVAKPAPQPLATSIAIEHPNLKKELIKVGIVAGICLAVLIILTRLLT